MEEAEKRKQKKRAALLKTGQIGCAADGNTANITTEQDTLYNLERVSSGTEALEVDDEDEYEDDDANDDVSHSWSTDSNGDRDGRAVGQRHRQLSEASSAQDSSSENLLNNRSMAMLYMREFSRLAQTVLRNSNHGKQLHAQLTAMLTKKEDHSMKLLGCLEHDSLFVLNP
uniref:Uncharacterized protein n=1 Tax=Lygus hesperus TaxID=30085 RepID=A0A0A9YEZ0_LYGHE